METTVCRLAAQCTTLQFRRKNRHGGITTSIRPTAVPGGDRVEGVPGGLEVAGTVRPVIQGAGEGEGQPHLLWSVGVIQSGDGNIE